MNESVEEQEIQLTVRDIIDDRSDDINDVKDLNWYFEEKHEYVGLDEWQWDEVWNRLMKHFRFQTTAF